MTTVEIDRAIRDRIAELRAPDWMGPLSGATDEERRELELLIGHYFPAAATWSTWERVCAISVAVCGPATSSDCRPGRLYELADDEIGEAEAWIGAQSDADLDHCTQGVPCDVPVDYVPGALITLDCPDGVTRRMPAAAYRYVGCAFPQ